jgi:hypothetical protein
MEKVKTRTPTACPIFGFPQDLKQSSLPTYQEVMQCYLYNRNELKEIANGKDPTVGDVSEIVAANIKVIWDKASLPTVSHKRILQLIRSYHEKYRTLIKPYKERKGVLSYQEKIQKFKDDSLKLFDISACKCKDFELCNCEKSAKVPTAERKFLSDQRGERMMMIGLIDVTTTAKNKKRAERTNKEIMRLSSAVTANPSSSKPEGELNRYTQESSLLEPQPGCSKYAFQRYTDEVNTIKQMRMRMPSLAVACDRTGVSDRSAAMIASAVLQDVGIINEEDTNLVVDRSKVRRERTKMRTELQKSDTEPVIGLYFDGRKDQTITQEKKGDKFYRRVVSESHYSLVAEPNSIYLGHVTALSGKSDRITNDILNYLTENSVDLTRMCIIGCDGTVVNTGPKGGIIRLIEINQRKPMHWFICQLHSNELPLRHLVTHLDGETTGPSDFSGPIGKQLKECEKLPVVSFEKIETEIPSVDNKSDLSTDQKYLYEILTAVSEGVCSADLANKYPGHMSHSRWLTTANRILRLYVSTKTPNDNLVILATFVAKVYGPMWFEIKTNPSCINGSIHVFKTIQKSRYLPQNLKAVVDPVIQRNAYFAHPENILLCMFGDDREVIRELGYRRIVKARSSKHKTIRQFVIPPLNFEATTYEDIINWNEVQVTEPPFLAKFSHEELKDFVSHGLESKIPCHTQAVERCVKLVNEASEAVCGNTARDGFIRSRLASRKKMPCFETKKEYAL